MQSLDVSNPQPDESIKGAVPLPVPADPGNRRAESTSSAVDGVIDPQYLSGSTAKGIPTPNIRSGFKQYRHICKELAELALELRGHLGEDGAMSETGLQFVLEVEGLLEKLYDCDWGQGDNLKRVAVLIESQTVGADWSEKLVKFISQYANFLATRYLVDDPVVKEGVAIIREVGLDQFRGTLGTI